MERVEGGATRTVIDEWVKPAHAVTHHLTAVSGVTATHLETATHTVSSVQDLMLTHVGVRDVLVGHSLANDLKVGALSPPPDSQTERAPCSTRGGFLVPPTEEDAVLQRLGAQLRARVRASHLSRRFHLRIPLLRSGVLRGLVLGGCCVVQAVRVAHARIVDTALLCGVTASWHTYAQLSLICAHRIGREDHWLTVRVYVTGPTTLDPGLA